MENTKMVTVQLSANEAFGFTDMSKSEFEAMLLTAVKCEMVFTKPTGEQVKLEIMDEIQSDQITFCDPEDGIEIMEADLTV